MTSSSRESALEQVDQALSVSVEDVWATMLDPKRLPAVVMAIVTFVGAVLLVLAQVGTEKFEYVPAQLPYLASGTLFGLALIGTGLRLLAVHLERVEAAEERDHIADVQRVALGVLGEWLTGRDRPADPVT